MQSNTLKIIIALAFCGVLVILTDPFMAFMPESGLMAALVCAAILMILWMGFVMFEAKGDEREEAHKAQAGRAAYLSGVGVLTIGFIMQGIAHEIDPWISGALGAMVLVKLVYRLYAEHNL